MGHFRWSIAGEATAFAIAVTVFWLPGTSCLSLLLQEKLLHPVSGHEMWLVAPSFLYSVSLWVIKGRYGKWRSLHMSFLKPAEHGTRQHLTTYFRPPKLFGHNNQWIQNGKKKAESYDVVSLTFLTIPHLCGSKPHWLKQEITSENMHKLGLSHLLQLTEILQLSWD